MTDNIISRECKFAIHIPAKRALDIPDSHLIKERVTVKSPDGKISSYPKIRMIKDFKRPIYITKPNRRNHLQKKETELLENVFTKSVTQSALRDEVAKLLEKPWSNDSLKQLSSSPYVYGSDITSTSLIKAQYMAKYPDAISAYSVATFDIETDVINGTEEIIMATIAFQDQLFTAVIADFVKGFSTFHTLIDQAIHRYIGDYTERHHMKPEVVIATDGADVIRQVFAKAHQLSPDFLAIWNMNFDIPKVLELLKRYNIDPREILCEPSLPMEYRICKYQPGPNKKVTSSGKVTPINPASQWHTLVCTSNFYVIDAMCSYKQIRLAKQEEPSYSLDAILNKELGIRKLKFKEADHCTGLKWHQLMQSNYKLEYIVYNMFDCISMLELDLKTKDLSLTLPTYAGVTDFSMFKSQPKRISDALYPFCLQRELVLGSSGFSKDEESLEPDILSLKDWIITLPAHLSVLGAACIAEDPTIRTGIRSFVYDSDMVSAYPSCISGANVSKATTKREVIAIDGIEESVFRMQNMNLLLGPTNAVEYSTNMFKLPTLHSLLTDFTAEKN